MKKVLLVVVLVVSASLAYLLLWPVPIDPVTWMALVAPGYSGVHAINNKLANLQRIDLHGEVEPSRPASWTFSNNPPPVEFLSTTPLPSPHAW